MLFGKEYLTLLFIQWIKTKTMKVPYQIRIEPEQLEAIRDIAKENGTSVNHEIRQAIRQVINK